MELLQISGNSSFRFGLQVCGGHVAEREDLVLCQMRVLLMELGRAPSNGKGFCRARVKGPLKLKCFVWA